MGFSGGTRVESVGTLRPSNGAGHRVGGPKRVMIFFLYMLKKFRE